jgi:endonuclease/exonuclease/phosphatase family metal-dependent hydrolase
MKSFSAATLNIWNRSGPWEQRLRAIGAHMKSLAPDVIGLQEVVRLDPGEGDELDQCDAIGGPLGYHSAYGRSREQRWFGNAVLSRWPITRSETIELPRGGTDERRCLLYAEIDAPFGLLPFFVTHLNWKLDEGHVRAEQVLLIARQVQLLSPPRAFPAVLVGDFNAEPGSDEIRYLVGQTSLGSGRRVYFQDAFAVAGGGSPGFTFARRNPFAAVVREPDRRIDYIFVHGRDERFRGEPLEARLEFDAAVDGTFPSDHFGVVARLRTD